MTQFLELCGGAPPKTWSGDLLVAAGILKGGFFVLSPNALILSNSPSRWRAELTRSKAAAVADRPFVTVSFAVSEDLCLSSTRGAPSRVSCDEALQVTHELRTAHDALLVGVGTVLSDDPVLTTRLAQGPSPIRVVLDSRLRTPAGARVLRSTSQPPLLITTSLATDAREAELSQAGAEVLRVAADPRGVALSSALAKLRSRGVGSLMVEGGSDVLESFFSAGLIDFLAVTISPQRLDNPQAVRLGPHARAALAGWKRSPERVGVDALFSGPLHAAVKAAS